MHVYVWFVHSLAHILYDICRKNLHSEYEYVVRVALEYVLIAKHIDGHYAHI